MYMKEDIYRGPKLGRSSAYWAARRSTADRDMTCVARRAARAWRTTVGQSAHWYVWGSPDPASKFRPARSARQAERGEPTGEAGDCWPCPGAGHGADLPFL